MPKTKDGIIIPFPVGEQKTFGIEVMTGDGVQELTIPWWVTSPEQEEAKRKLLLNRFFLLKQGTIGEMFICKECKGKHQYFTLMCIERPFDGLSQGLSAYYHNIGRAGISQYLSTSERRRYDEIAKVVSSIGGNRNLADSHPEFAKHLETKDDDYDVGALALGLLEPITRAKAEALAWNINLRGIKPPFRLEGLEGKNG